MNNIFRVPVDNQHFKDTIEIGKPLAEVSKFLTGEELALVKRISKDGNVRYWGSLPGDSNKRNFEKLKEGDELICYRSGNYIALAKIAFKTFNPNLAKYSWGETELKTTWELIYFFDEIILFQIDSGIINKEFGFKDGPVMGFNAINDEKAKEFNQKYGSVKNFLKTLGEENPVQKTVAEEISKIQINSPFEAQFYLVDLGNQLEYETYVPSTDAGHEVFGKKLGELVTIRKEDLTQYVAPAILSPLSNIDVIWFKGNYSPRFFYEVIHHTGMNEAFARLKTVNDYYDSAKTRIIGTKETSLEFEKSHRLYFPNSKSISYKYYDDLLHVHSETLHYKHLVEEFLD